MSDDDFWAEQTGGLIGIGAAAVALAFAPDTAALLPLVPPASAIAVRSLRRRWMGVWAGYKSVESAPEAEARARLLNYQSNEGVQDAVLETFRRMEEALEPEVLFALGRLLWPYTHTGRKPDRFFRNVGRMLIDMDSHDLAGLTALLRAVATQPPPDTAKEQDTISLQAWMTDADGVSGTGRFDAPRVQDGKLVLLPGQSGLRAFAALKANGFGISENRWGMESADSLKLSVTQARRILDVVDFGETT